MGNETSPPLRRVSRLLNGSTQKKFYFFFQILGINTYIDPGHYGLPLSVRSMQP
jgi:hypothetical protein